MPGKEQMGKITIEEAGSRLEYNAKRVLELKAVNAELLGALKKAFRWSCDRSETYRKWSVQDQTTHEILKQAIARAESE